MALKKTLKSTYGINAEYWIVNNVVLDSDRKIARITMAGYPTQDIRQEDTEPLMKLTVNCRLDKYDEYFSIEELDKENNNPIKIAYEYAKSEDEFFKDAEDLN